MDYAALGKRIRQERKRLNYTQEMIAEKVDLSDAYIGQIERGERNLSLESLVKLCNELGVTVDYLLHDSIEIDESEDHYMSQIKQLLHKRPAQEQRMALDLLKVMFNHLDEYKGS